MRLRPRRGAGFFSVVSDKTYCVAPTPGPRSGGRLSFREIEQNPALGRHQTMRTACSTLLLAVIAAATAARTARAADERLLVVVESAPGVAVDAREVRQTIGTELGIPVVAPTDAAAAGASNVLLVAIDKSEIRMSLHGSAAGLVARTIPLPPDRPARLREIGWLAGNLARDQVSGIVAVPAERPAATKKELVIAAADVATATEPPPVTAPSSEPTVAASARPSEPAAATGPRWAITGAGGPTASFFWNDNNIGETPTVLRGSTYELEAQRQASPGSLIFGAALEVGTAPGDDQRFGLAGLVGSSWQHRRWFLETTGGVGLGLVSMPQATRTVTNSSLSGSSSETTVSTELQPVLYLRGMGTVGFPISSALDLVARVGVHLASSGGFATDFLSATAGLRFRIP
jgi:hypothetical protein